MLYLSLKNYMIISKNKIELAGNFYQESCATVNLC